MDYPDTPEGVKPEQKKIKDPIFSVIFLMNISDFEPAFRRSCYLYDE